MKLPSNLQGKSLKKIMVILSTAVVQNRSSFFHLSIFKKLCFSAGLYPGTEYLISVQAIKGTTEGKSSSVTGATGQHRHITIHLF